VLIFGNNRPYPGALLLRSESARDVSDQQLLDAIRPIVEKLNKESQDHARIPYDMLIPLPVQEQPLEKSSKGTIIRRAAESRFEDVIERAYDEQNGDETADVPDEHLSQHLTGLIQSMTSQSAELTEDMDLFSYGVDSIACMQLRTRVRRLIPNCEQALPMSIIEDCGTVQRLVNYVLRMRHGESDVMEENEQQLMLDLVKQYGSFEENVSRAETDGQSMASAKEDVVVLTGATGALGAHILDLLQKDEKVSSIYCLVRGVDEHAARERVSQALHQRGLSLEKPDGKVKVVPAQLGEERLGLSEELYSHLAEAATSIIHVAWTVNFRLKLRSFVDNIAGVRNLIDLALAASHGRPARFTYCSSTAAVMNGDVDSSGCYPEEILSDPLSASPLGYSQSKWVAEHICAAAHARTKLHGQMAVVRVGQLAGASQTGVWNTKEAWPMMLSTAGVIQCLPDLADEALDWLPVDIAAQAFVETTRARGDGVADEMAVYHVLNPHREPSWHTMLCWLQKKAEFEIVPPQTWIERLEQSAHVDHSAMKLLGLWKQAYSTVREEEAAATRPQFAMAETRCRVPVLREVRPLDEAYVGRVWEWVRENVQ
jgi:thioester reductase-like protein